MCLYRKAILQSDEKEGICYKLFENRSGMLTGFMQGYGFYPRNSWIKEHDFRVLKHVDTLECSYHGHYFQYPMGFHGFLFKSDALFTLGRNCHIGIYNIYKCEYRNALTLGFEAHFDVSQDLNIHKQVIVAEEIKILEKVA